MLLKNQDLEDQFKAHTGLMKQHYEEIAKDLKQKTEKYLELLHNLGDAGPLLSKADETGYLCKCASRMQLKTLEQQLSAVIDS